MDLCFCRDFRVCWSATQDRCHCHRPPLTWQCGCQIWPQKIHNRIPVEEYFTKFYICRAMPFMVPGQSVTACIQLGYEDRQQLSSQNACWPAKASGPLTDKVARAMRIVRGHPRRYVSTRLRSHFARSGNMLLLNALHLQAFGM